MDTITDILSTFFVSAPKRRTQHQKKQVSTDSTSIKQENEKVTVQEEKNEDNEHLAPIPQEVVSEDEKQSDSLTFTETDDDNDDQNQDIPDTKVFVPKKYVMKANELTKKDIVVVNKEIDENLTTVGDFLHMMSLMKNVEQNYSSSTYIITSNDNKKLFKQMLLENPYLHFTDFIVRTSLSKTNVSDIASSNKRTVIMIDADIQGFDENTFNKYLELRSHNVQIVLLSTQYANVSKFYNALGEHRLLIHRKERLKSMQRVFFKQVIKSVCVDDIDFDNYFYVMNHDNFGVRYVIVKSNELRYN